MTLGHNSEMESDNLIQVSLLTYSESKWPKIALGDIVFMPKLICLVDFFRGRWRSSCLILKIMFVSNFFGHFISIFFHVYFFAEVSYFAVNNVTYTEEGNGEKSLQPFEKSYYCFLWKDLPFFS